MPPKDELDDDVFKSLDDEVTKRMKDGRKKKADYSGEDGKESGDSSSDDSELDDPIIKTDS